MEKEFDFDENTLHKNYQNLFDDELDDNSYISDNDYYDDFDFSSNNDWD